MATEQALPKFAAIAETLRLRILEGVYAPGTRLPSSNDLPAEFGVGKQTIVRVLGDLSREGLIVSRQGRGTFVATVLPPSNDRDAKTKALTIALLFRRTLSPEAYQMRGWFGGVVAGVLNQLGMSPAQVQVSIESGDRSAPGRVRLRQPGIPHRVELLGEPPSFDTGVPIPEIFALRPDAILPVSIFDDAYLQRLLDAADVHGVPTVLVDYWTRRLGARTDCVVVDNHPGYHAATENLLGRGLTRIHFVGAYSASHTPGHFRDVNTKHGRVDPDSYLRMAAWRQALDEAGLEAPASWTHYSTSMPTDLDRLAERLWSLPAEERPQAVVCHNMHMAERLREDFARRGSSLAAVGVGEPGSGAHLTVSAEDIGRTAADLARQRLRAPQVSLARRPFVKAAVPTLFQHPSGGTLS